MIVEILDGNDPCEPGRMGELVITELNDYAMPLIRYRTGDYAMIAVKPCSCGRCTRRIREHIDSDAEIVFELVNEIAREKSGKQRLIVGLPTAG
ncbi:MAG: hypothetical protein IPH09_18735 [bacterium]|nr:hypothetical protein [bacterium]